jgi:hypothetical protein
MFSLTEHPAQPDNTPDNDEYINIDIRVMGQTVLQGWVQILWRGPPTRERAASLLMRQR